MIICIAANLSTDRLFEVEHLVKGDIHPPIGFVQKEGGKGLNIARAARQPRSWPTARDLCGMRPVSVPSSRTKRR